MRLAASTRAVPLLLALAATTCERTTPTTEPTTAPTDAPPRPKADDAKPSTPAAEPTHPLELVPARARAMIMARSPQRLAEIWGREGFRGRFTAHYERLVTDMRQATGHDLLDPAGLAAIGIDPTAPAGVAVLSFEHEAFVAFGGCSDPSALVELLQRLTGKPLERVAVGPAELVKLDDEVSLVIRHGLCAFVLVDRPASGLDYPREVARIDPAQSLAHATVMERAHAGLPHEADAHALLDVAGIVRDALEQERRREQERMGESSRRLAEARQRGASASEITDLQRMMEEEQTFLVRQRRERQVAEILLSRTLGTIEGIGLVANADARGLHGRLHVALAPDAVLRELFVPSERPPSAIVALGDAPQLVISAEVDVGVAIDLFAQAALATGSSYPELNDDVLREFGFDFDRALRPLLDGRGTFVMTAGPPLDPKRAQDVKEAFGGVVAIGVTDEAKARALLDDVKARAQLDEGVAKRITETPEIGGWTLARPDKGDGPAAFHFGVVNGQLVAGTDLAVLRRLRDGQAGQASTHFPDPEPWQRLTEGPGVGRLALHHRLPVSLAFAFTGMFDSFDFRNADSELSAEFPGEDVFSIPRSRATVRLEQERDRTMTAQHELEGRRRRERQIVAWNRAAALGITAGVVREVETGLVIEGGHYVTGGIAGYAETIVGLIEAGDAKTDADPELARLRKRRDLVEQRVLEARRKDVKRELARRKRAQGS